MHTTSSAHGPRSADVSPSPATADGSHDTPQSFPLSAPPDIEAFLDELRELARQDAASLPASIVVDGDGSTADLHGPDVDRNTPPPPSRRASAPRQSQRYEIVERIAVGGMGLIYRARDRQLDREVALKVLLTPNDAPALLTRFVTEARVLARLQHPGIPAVYEEGWLPDGRAFIAMKLVHGHTLGELLRARPAPNVEVVKYLTIFRQLCEAVAFAHANGILHRDLKPDNVMVGAFGEVQLIDWGLAKRLDAGDLSLEESLPHALSKPTGTAPPARSGPGMSPPSDALTVMGGPMGTPSYMPPEQARGLHDQVNRASDVFSLGAILCKILTGEKAYRGENPGELLEASRSADLDDARERLHHCGADDVLQQLALRCLQVDPARRPQSAGEVVEIIDAHLNSQQDRLWEMELARTKEQEQVRRRRLTMALVLCASLLIAIVAGGWTIVSRQAADRLRSAVAAVSKSLGEAEQLRDTALAHPLDGEPYWLGADESMRQARAVASQAADPELSQRVGELESEIEQLARQARQDRQLVAQLAAAATPISFVEMLERSTDLDDGDRNFEPAFLHDRRPPDGSRRHGPPHGHHRPPHRGPHRDRHRPAPPGQPPRSLRHRLPPHHEAIHYAVSRDRYVDALANYGLDPRVTSPATAVQLLLARPAAVRQEVVDGMHRWFGVLMKRAGEDPQYTDWALTLLATIDDDPQRNEVRQLVADGDDEALLPLLDEPQLLDHPPSFLWLVSQQLPDLDEGHELLLRARNRYPASLVVNEELADYYHHTGQRDKAITAFMNVLAIQENAHTYSRTALCMWREGRITDAIMMCRNAIRLGPADSDAYALLAKVLLEERRYEETLQVIDEAHQTLPADSELLKLMVPLQAQARDELDRHA